MFGGNHLRSENSGITTWLWGTMPLIVSSALLDVPESQDMFEYLVFLLFFYVLHGHGIFKSIVMCILCGIQFYNCTLCVEVYFFFIGFMLIWKRTAS